MKKVAVEKGLNPVKSFLNQQGYQVREFDCNKKSNSNYLNNFDAVVVTGQSENMLGMQDATISSSIINADGMTPQEVMHQLEQN